MSFFSQLYKHCDVSDGYLEIRTLPDRKQFWLTTPDIPDNIMSLETNVFFGVGLRSRREGTADAVSSIPCLWMDVDLKDFDGDMATCAYRLFYGFQWHAIVKTGGGFHAYRRLERPARTSEEKAILISAVKELAKRLGGDKAACDAARILRVPGTKNYKYCPPKDVIVKFQNWEVADLPWDELKAMAPEVTVPDQKHLVEVPEEIQRIVDRCAFMKHCVDSAATLPEPEWFAWISNLCGIHKSPRYIHEVSRRYPKYSPAETDRKILHALDDSAPISCEKIKSLWDCGQVCGVKSPCGLAWRTITVAPEVAATKNPFRGEGQEAEEPCGIGDSPGWILEGLRRLRVLTHRCS